MLNQDNSITRMLKKVRRNPRRFFASSFVAYATLWTLLEPILSFVRILDPYLVGWPKYVIFLLVSLLIGAVYTLSPKEFSIKLNKITIKIVFGDLFSSKGLKVIPISRFMFETEVARSSLQNVVIREFMECDEGTKGLEEYQRSLTDAL